MDFKLSEREELLRKSAREFAESEITPKVEAMETTGEFPVDLLKPMAKLGITGIIAPREYEGVDLGYLARTIVLEEMARVCGAVSMGMQVHHMACAALKDFAIGGFYAVPHPTVARHDMIVLNSIFWSAKYWDNCNRKAGAPGAVASWNQASASFFSSARRASASMGV